MFISKGGVGPKTSILVFEKGGQTKDVWFYKVTNDGYTMGTNRRPIEGCQLVEALELFDKYVRHDKTPPETKHSFSVPVAWILNLDPRVKRRIEADTTTDFSERAAKEREPLAAKLADQLRDGKITETDRGERLAQQDEVWRVKTLNEIAKRIEAAHLYSFNLPNTRSNLSKSQLEEWNAVFKGAKRKNGHPLDARYAALKDCPPEKAHSALAMLDVQDSIEFDIARQYLMVYPVEELAKRDQLATLRKIIESGARYPRVRLGDYLRLNADRIKPGDFPETRFRVLGVSNTDGVFLNETKSGAEIKQANFRVKPNEFDYDNQIISGAYNIFGTDETELLPYYLLALFKSPQFLAYVNEKAHGGVRMNFKYEDLEEWEIPLAPTPIQEALASAAARMTDFEKGICLVQSTWRLRLPSVEGLQVSIGDLVAQGLITIGSGDFLPAKAHEEGAFPVFGGNDIQGHHTAFNSPPPCISVGRVGALCGCVHLHQEPCWITDNAFRITTNENEVLVEYLAIVLQEADLNNKSKLAAQPSINQADVKGVAFTLPSLAKQQKVIGAVKQQQAVFTALTDMSRQIESEVETLLGQVWGENV